MDKEEKKILKDWAEIVSHLSIKATEIKRNKLLPKMVKDLLLRKANRKE